MLGITLANTKNVKNSILNYVYTCSFYQVIAVVIICITILNDSINKAIILKGNRVKLSLLQEELKLIIYGKQ